MKDHAEIRSNLVVNILWRKFIVNSLFNVQQTTENCGRLSLFRNDKPARGAEGEGELSRTTYIAHQSFIYLVFPQLNFNLC